MYGKCSKILNHSLSVSNKMLVRIANSENPDQTASELIWVCTVCLPFWQAISGQYFRIFTILYPFKMSIFKPTKRINVKILSLIRVFIVPKQN